MNVRIKRVLGGWFTAVALASGGVAAGGCAMDASPDAQDDVGVVPGGKADGSDYSACELDGVVGWLNGGPSADEIADAGVHRRAANNLAARRDGADGAFGTEDDAPFADIADVDSVYYVGRVAIRQLVEVVREGCTTPPPSAGTEVIFSPQPYEASHLARITELLNGAERSIDLALYSFSDSAARNALGAAAARGVSVRVIFEGAGSDRSDPEGSTSAQLEDLGIEVRYVNKIMHHKFAIIDGARADLSEADAGILVTGSGNWSRSAATRYDENTVIVRGNRELNVRYQQEFNHLWTNSRPFEWNESIAPIEAIDVAPEDVPDDADVDAVFTSANFTTYESSRYGPTFTVTRGSNVVADRWVELIMGAQRSIRVASGHLRSRAISEAIMAAQAANPALDVRVYLDNQEYLSEWAHDDQEAELATCLSAAGDSEASRQDCLDRGFLFGYQLHQAGVPVRFKYYAYRWDYSYADQMHHKYMIIDEELLLTGSYNLSDNAEHNTMENVVIFQGAAHRGLVEAYVDNFDALWVTGEEDGLYASLMDEVQNGTGDFPIVFDSMALDWDEVTALKQAIRDACPLINSTEYRRNAAAHRYCDR